MAQADKDPLTGVETTGHAWDGIRELNTPLPTWWLYVLWATVAWAIGYWIVYPAWPGLSDYTRGVLGYSSRAELARSLEEAAQARAPWLEKFQARTVAEIAKDNQLLAYAMAGGRAVFADNCAPCHGAGGAGAPNYPVLADDDWLWGGTLEAIEATIRFGVRSGHAEARVSEMPSFGADGTLRREEIGAVADYVIALAKGGSEGSGKQIFADNCAACHGPEGQGMAEVGGPNLTDAIWLYGSGRDPVIAQVTKPRHGVMPAWQGRLKDVEIKQAAIYVHALGGGK